MKILTEVLWVFSVFSFLGWVLKFVYETVKKRRPSNPGFITLPFLPSNGIAMVLVYVLFSKAESMFIIFFGCAILLTIYKFFLSMLFEKSFGFKWKDYSKKRFNLNGYVSVWEPFAYGALGILAIRYAFNPMLGIISGLPAWLALLIPAIISALIFSDLIISVITVVNLRKNLEQMKNISNLIDDNNGEESDEELRKRYEQRIIKNKRFRLRLVSAFPDMQSLNYEKQLSDIREWFNIIREKNDEEYEKKIEREDDKPFAYGLSFTKLFWLFFIGSIFGTVLETIWCFFMEGHFEMRVGLVIGPFIPVYGGGAVAITLCLYKLHKSSDLIVYLSSAVIGATFEYFCSYFQETFLGTVSWDYSKTPFNLNGRTNLTFALIWGVLGLVWLRYIYPFLSRLIEKIPKKSGTIITVILVIFMALDSAVSIAAVYRGNQRANNIKPQNVAAEWIDNTFNDDYMNFVFPHMATREEFTDFQ